MTGAEVAAASEALGLGHEGLIEPHLMALRRQLGVECPSEYAFANLYLFRHAHRYRYLPGRFPCISGVTYDGIRHLLPLFDLHRATQAELIDLLDGHHCFYPVPGAWLSRFHRSHFSATALAEDSDYIYPARNFREYGGAVLRKKRQLMRRLLDGHRMEDFPLTADRAPEAREVLARWAADKGKGMAEADIPECGEALALMERLALVGRVYHADGAPVGFVIGQRLAEGIFVIRFAKGVDSHTGIYQYMFHHFCSQPGVSWLNFEQDLGLANFRRTKTSYAPSALLAKWRVGPHPSAPSVPPQAGNRP